MLSPQGELYSPNRLAKFTFLADARSDGDPRRAGRLDYAGQGSRC